MITIREERKAFHEVALIFSEWGWGFKEQNQDWGFDVLIEMAYQKRLTGKVVFFQIKGGESNFYRGRHGVTFYFSQEHKDYWLTLGERNPFFIILDDFSEGKIYWFLLTEEKIVRTSKEFKVIIPYENLLNVDARERFENILVNYPFEADEDDKVLSDNKSIKNTPFDLEIFYKIDVKKGLLCCLKEKKNKINIVLGYNPDVNSWDKEKEELDWKDPYYYTLWDLKQFIRDKYLSLKLKDVSNILESIKYEIESIVEEEGIQKLAGVLFDWDNLGKDIYKYKDFVRAFEQFSGLSKGRYKVRTVGQTVEFVTNNKKYVIDTYQGKTWELKTLIENECYEEIYTETDEYIWSEIYLDGGIEKIDFIPKMLEQWERYWDQLYRQVEENVGETSHLDSMKESSWKRFQIFEAGYDDIGDIIRYAWELGDMELYPIAVLTMMNIFDRECCYEEYCECEFYGGVTWKSICLDNNDEGKFFYIKEQDE